MKAEDLVTLLRRTKDQFSAILIYAPDEFPAQYGSLDEEFSELVEGVKNAHDRLGDKEKQTWLGVCLKELSQTLDLYKSGEDFKAAMLLQLAEEHFDNALSGKKTKAAFAVSPDGDADRME